MHNLNTCIIEPHNSRFTFEERHREGVPSPSREEPPREREKPEIHRWKEKSPSRERNQRKSRERHQKREKPRATEGERETRESPMGGEVAVDREIRKSPSRETCDRRREERRRERGETASTSPLATHGLTGVPLYTFLLTPN
ncbi:hypothetical protein F2Q69_00001892 [Brassica cretica]|uniref:Uncharacterized protein n=1 Tax=Brassica cretica TaxID=69181 RepID=A0A8S9P8W4_BRACR|nr:hypothetical protein F2Q69_00001892 [Brassica cretica]